MKILSLDLSTTNTGWCILDSKTKKIISLGNIKPLVKNPSKRGIKTYQYPTIQLLKMRDIAERLKRLVAEDIDVVVVEEVCRHKARLTGKVLDGLHFIFLDRLSQEQLTKIKYVDVSWWRQKLGIRLSEYDKEQNKEIRRLNKKVRKEHQKKPIDWKDLSQRYVKKRFAIDAEDADIADSICVGISYIDFML